MPRLIVVASWVKVLTDDVVRKKIDTLKSDDTIICQGAPGAEMVAVQCAAERGLDTIVALPEWKLYKRGSHYKKNAQMLNMNPDMVIIFRGAKRNNDRVRKLAWDATAREIPVESVTVEEHPVDPMNKPKRYNWKARMGRRSAKK